MNPRSKPDSATVLSSYPDSGGLGCGYVMNRWGFAVGSVSMALGDGVADERLSPRVASLQKLVEWRVVAGDTVQGDAGSAVEKVNLCNNSCPRWLAIVLPSMIELSHIGCLHFLFPQSSRDTISFIINRRKCFLNKEKVDQNFHSYPPLLSYLEALPPTYVNEKDICKNLSEDGSLFQSPSATAKAFIDYGNKKCLAYLRSLAQRCPKEVPQSYPMDEDHIKLCIANQLHRFGLGQYFVREIEVLLTQVYRKYNKEKDIRFLRTHGFKVSPLYFCWFLNHEELKAEIERDYEHFSNAMLHVFRASNLMFCGEYELEEARTFSRKILEKNVSTGKGALFQKIEHELSFPWFARLDHLEYRGWIQETEASVLWKGNTSYNRVSGLYNDELLQLATLNFEFKQLIYKNELTELKKWVEKCGMSNMGFGREKSTYCYFAVNASLTSVPHDSYVRILIAKTAIIITVNDDFFDTVGSLNELEILTEAVQRWDARGLSSHSKVIFDALDSLQLIRSMVRDFPVMAHRCKLEQKWTQTIY
ncbi:unnamed protein product [Vicia faba]|uniref:Uncharacterized protein n=1 Tax=Vicia faba TaxID=3906 RepID=A0AAV1AGV2_VICFA|nr:unnamed protein product [Vicia faba]